MATERPYVWCEPTCPRQATDNPADCTCGGVREQFKARVKAQEEAAAFAKERYPMTGPIVHKMSKGAVSNGQNRRSHA